MCAWCRGGSPSSDRLHRTRMESNAGQCQPHCRAYPFPPQASAARHQPAARPDPLNGAFLTGCVTKATDRDCLIVGFVTPAQSLLKKAPRPADVGPDVTVGLSGLTGWGNEGVVCETK